MSETSCDISGLLAGLKIVEAAGIAAAQTAVSVFAQHVIGDAQQLAPVDTGFLAASGVAEAAKLEGTQISAELGFNASYAAAVHERLDQKHSQGQAKFLETAIKKNAGKFEEFVGNRVKAVVER